MEYLYVCHFSNSHIKVGRSIDPVSRIASHVDRVGCMGVELVYHHVSACPGNVGRAEADLIEMCAAQAEARHLNEWFTGLQFSDVCQWADECAARDYPAPSADIRRPDGSIEFGAVIRALMAQGITQTQMAAQCNCCQGAISNLVMRKNSEPSYSIGTKLMAMYAAHVEQKG